MGKEVRTYIWETDLQKHTRSDAELHSLEQGSLAHVDVQAVWEVKLMGMGDAGLDGATAATAMHHH